MVGPGDTVDISVFHHHITVVFIQIVKVHICHCHVQLFIVYQSTGADRTVFQKLDWDIVPNSNQCEMVSVGPTTSMRMEML